MCGQRAGRIAQNMIESTSGVLAALLPQQLAVGDNQKLYESAYASLEVRRPRLIRKRNDILITITASTLLTAID
jgi:hypothetical protein